MKNQNEQKNPCDLYELSSLMKRDWERRITHDYRFWMSDGFKSDELMWETGRRDFEIFFKTIKEKHRKEVLEIGCGVGRLLKAAAFEFSHVTGIDISEEAVLRAREFLRDIKNVDIYTGNGFDLRQFPNERYDLVYSFASLTSMPTDIIASYILEANRVLKKKGLLHLQLYLGKTQQITCYDTLHLRCFEEERIQNAFTKAGFQCIEKKRLELPFEVSVKEAEIFAHIVTFEKQERSAAKLQEISEALLPGGELQIIEHDEHNPRELESWMSMNYAKALAHEGNSERAREVMQYAENVAKANVIDTKDLLERIITTHEKKTETEDKYIQNSAEENNYIQASHNNFSQWEKNRCALKDQKLLDSLDKLHKNEKKSDEIFLKLKRAGSNEGDVLLYDDLCLDHKEKPLTAAKIWAKKVVGDPIHKNTDCFLIFGFGSGYHVKELSLSTEKKIVVIEPYMHVLYESLCMHDYTELLKHVTFITKEALETITELPETTSLLVRPQTQAVASDMLFEVKRIFSGSRGIAKLKPYIGVLGPLQGGTLPILHYVTKTLQEQKQRVKCLDMSGFAGGFHSLEVFSKDKFRQAVNQNRYVEFLSNAILESFQESSFDLFICMAQAPISLRALQEMKKNGVITALWFTEDYNRFSYWKEFAPFYDYIFTIQKDECIDSIKQAGCSEVHYLPMAADLDIHTLKTLNEEEMKRWGSKVSFVGAGYHNRQQVFASLSKLPFKIWGTEWPVCKPFDAMVQEEGRRLTPEEYVKIFNATEVNINLHSSTEKDGVDPYGDFINPRTFELAAVNAFQLVDKRSLLSECFEIGKEVITFENTLDLKEKIQYYLGRPDERRMIAEAARLRVLREHTYKHRIQKMLSIIYAGSYEKLKAKEHNQPWHKLIERSKVDKELNERCERAYDRGEEPKLDALVSDIYTGKGKLTETEQKLLFLFHVRKQIIMMRREEAGSK
jgi:spore maturation protein CgeB